jgi:plastocyanin
MVAFSLWVWGCSSSTGYDGSPVAPTPALPTDVVMIDVTSINGAQSFSPDPASLPAGHTVVWRNVDRVTHRVVFQNGMLDTGHIAPGASSQPVLVTTGGPYHCSIHPSMVGTVVAPSALSPAN